MTQFCKYAVETHFLISSFRVVCVCDTLQNSYEMSAERSASGIFAMLLYLQFEFATISKKNAESVGFFKRAFPRSVISARTVATDQQSIIVDVS